MTSTVKQFFPVALWTVGLCALVYFVPWSEGILVPIVWLGLTLIIDEPASRWLGCHPGETHPIIYWLQGLGVLVFLLYSVGG